MTVLPECSKLIYSAGRGVLGDTCGRATGRATAPPAGHGAVRIRHRWLRELGQGWQLVETSSPTELEANDFSAGAVQLATHTGAPVLVAEVNDGCASLHTAAPDRLTCLAHVPDPTQPCIEKDWHHPAPVGRAVDDVVADLLAWADAGGLVPCEPQVRRYLRRSMDDEPYVNVYEMMLHLLIGLGMEQVGTTRPYTLDIFQPPFHLIAGEAGLGQWAHRNRSRRYWSAKNGRPVEPEQPWEPMAIALDADLWASWRSC